jgi:adenine-specific DNA-methyltransferase
MAKASADELERVILQFVPADGSNIGNQSLHEQVRQGARAARIGSSDTAFEQAREALIADGTLLKGRGRGGSVRLAQPKGETGFALQAAAVLDEPWPLEGGPKRRPAAKGAPALRTAGSSDDDATVLSYRHSDKRMNNPRSAWSARRTSRPRPGPSGATTRTWTRRCSSTWAARRWNG